MLFLVCCFSFLGVLWLVFCVWKSCKSVTIFFFSFGGFCGVAYSCLFGFGRFRCFCGSCVCFSFVQVLFLFVLALFLFWCWIVVGVVLVLGGFLCFSCFLCFWDCYVLLLFLFGGFKGQVRWPKGPPHLALDPPYFLLFVLCFGFPVFALN